MNCRSIPFDALPFTKLFHDYTAQVPEILKYFETNPYSEHELNDRIDYFRFNGDRLTTVQILKEFNKEFDVSENTLSSIDKLAEKNSLAVVTGQQLTLYGGPLLTVYKVLSAISFSKRLERDHKIPVVPVFWLADEDHDYDEVAKIGFPDHDELKTFFWKSDQKPEKPVGILSLGDAFGEFREQVKSVHPKTDFSAELWQQLDRMYTPGTTLRNAFGKWLLHLFGKYGLILAGSHVSSVKAHTIELLQRSVQHHQKLYQVLSHTSGHLIKDGYHSQVHVQPSNLFWINDRYDRVKIHHNNVNDRWYIDQGEIEKEWATDELLADIDRDPERFSPNVFLRPVLQDHLLPTIAYVAGPGEIAYYAQMKTFYKEFGKQMPVVFPRFSATFIESGIDRIMKKLPFSFVEYVHRIEDLESGYVESMNSLDIETVFDRWREQVDAITTDMKTEVSKFDPTLEGSAGKTKAIWFTELDKLKGKVYRSVKQQEKTQLLRIQKIKNNIFPDGNLQEREVAFIYLMNKYGPDIWDEFLRRFDEEQPDTHKLFCLR